MNSRTQGRVCHPPTNSPSRSARSPVTSTPPTIVSWSWSDGATQSCAHWLNWKCGIALGAAREKVRVARALGKLPKISAAMASGKLGYSKVRAITRVGILDDGALRFVRPDGQAVDRVLPGCSQPAGDPARLPTGKFEPSWRGERMDLHLAVELMIQESRKVMDVPAGTSGTRRP